MIKNSNYKIYLVLIWSRTSELIKLLNPRKSYGITSTHQDRPSGSDLLWGGSSLFCLWLPLLGFFILSSRRNLLLLSMKLRLYIRRGSMGRLLMIMGWRHRFIYWCISSYFLWFCSINLQFRCFCIGYQILRGMQLTPNRNTTFLSSTRSLYSWRLQWWLFWLRGQPSKMCSTINLE